MNENKEARISSLDGIRGIAVLMVIAFHYVNNQMVGSNWLINVFGKPAAMLKKITYFGWSGVDFFFILSGFLIGNILLKNKGSKSLFKTFYIRRFFRIIPAYYLLLLLFVLTSLTPFYNSKAQLFERPLPITGYFLFIQNFFMSYYNHFGPQALTPTWSLCVEEQFYLIIPFFISIVQRKYVWMLAVAGIAIAIISRALSENFYQAYTLLPSRIDSPMIGLFLAWLHQYPSCKNWITKNIFVLWTAFAVLICFCAWLYSQTDPDIYGHTLLGILFGILVTIAIYSKNSFTNMLSAPILLEVGRLSYFIYLYHQIINGLLHLYFLKQLVPVLDSYKAILTTVVSLLVTYLLARLSFKYIESPVIRYSHSYKY